MKKALFIILVVGVVGLLVMVIAGMYKFNYLASSPGYDVDGNQIESTEQSNPKNTTYVIEGVPVTLRDGYAEVEEVAGSATKTQTNYFGNEVTTDLNNDGREDLVFLLTQSGGGTGTFYYVVASLNTENGWIGSSGFLLGDRIAPQTTELSSNPSHDHVIVVNYADRTDGQPMTEAPAVGKSVWLKLDVATLSFGEVEQNFAGEADPDRMTLDMQPWTWIKTTYANGPEVSPKNSDAFTITFQADERFSATTDCNTMGGSYEVDGKSLKFGEVFMTKMFCAESQEQEFAKMLSEIESFTFTSKGELVFDLRSVGGSMVLR